MLGVGVLVDSWMFREWLQGSKPNSSKSSSYHWKAIETKMSKIDSHDPFGHLKHKLWPKEGLGVKLAIWLATTKNQESPQFRRVQVACRWCATYSWKAIDENYNFVSDFISIEGLHIKLWGPKVTGVPTLAISGLSLGSPGTKSHLDVGLMKRHKVYYKGEGDGFLQVRAMVSLMNPSLLVTRPSTKSAPIMH